MHANAVLVYNFGYMTELPGGYPGFPHNFESPTAAGGGDDDAENEAKQKEAESYYRNQEMDEERAKSQPEINRLLNQETTADIASVLAIFDTSKNIDFNEAADQFTERHALGIALARHRTLAKPFSYLTDPQELVVIDKTDRKKPGKINPDGFPDANSEVRSPGYSIRVEAKIETEEIPVVQRAVEFERDASGARTGKSTEKITEIIEKRPKRTERVYFGTENERKVLSQANLELVKHAITGEKTHSHAMLLWNLRADIGTMVKTAYMKDINSSNKQIDWTYNAPEIREMDINRENTTEGDRRDLATRLLELAGHTETKEKIEKLLNTTFHLEEILTDKVQDRVLGIMKKLKRIDDNDYKSLKDGVDRKDDKYLQVARFLLGDSLVITNDGPKNPDGSPTKQYKLGGWLTYEQRDPINAGNEVKLKKRPDGKFYSTGADSVMDETSDGLRGWLTEFGNPYAGGRGPVSRDCLLNIQSRIVILVGNADSVQVADEKFYWWGERDELGAEIYSWRLKTDEEKKKGYGTIYDIGDLTPNLPTGEEITNKRNELKGQGWLKWAGDIKKRVSVTGEPVATDLCKLIHTGLWRLRDALSQNGRPAGPYITIDKFPRLTQALLGLARSQVNVGVDKEGVDIIRTRKVREQWSGSKDKVLGNVTPKRMGDIEWQKTTTPQEVLDVLMDETKEEIDWEQVGKKAHVPERLKKTIEAFNNGDKKAMENLLDETIGLGDAGIGAGVELFFTTMNYLTGDENEVKRPWAEITTPLKPDTLTMPDGWTGKIKFADISLMANGAFEDYKEVEKRALLVGEVINSDEDLMKFVGNESKAKVVKFLHDWLQGVLSDPQFPTWVTKSVDYADDNNNTKSTTWGKLIMMYAEVYGFADSDQLQFMRNIIRTKIIK